MLNLAELKHEFKLVWVDGEEITIKEPTFAMINQFMTLFNDNEGLEEIIPLLTALLNNNENHRVFSEKDLEELTVTQMGALVKLFVDYIDGIDKDPK